MLELIKEIRLKFLFGSCFFKCKTTPTAELMGNGLRVLLEFGHERLCTIHVDVIRVKLVEAEWMKSI